MDPYDYYLLPGICITAIGLWNLMIAMMGLFPQCRSTAVGILRRTNTKRNVKGKYGSIIPILTSYTYTYDVNGKTYRFAGESGHTKKHYLPRVTIVYIKWFPRHAYPNRFTGIKEWVAAFVMLLIGVYAVFAAIL